MLGNMLQVLLHQENNTNANNFKIKIVINALLFEIYYFQEVLNKSLSKYGISNRIAEKKTKILLDLI